MRAARRFLDWTRPALSAAVDHLLDEAEAAARSERENPESEIFELDLSPVLIVLPGKRAARRMLEQFVSTAEHRGLRLIPPKLITVGQLPEQLYASGAAPVVSQLTRRLLLAEALRSIDPETLQAIAPTPPAENDSGAWATLAQTVERLHVELAAARLRFADVPPLAEPALPDFADHERFAALAAVQQAYFDRLDALELEDRERARLRALETGSCRYAGGIVLLAINYLPPVTRAMLDRIDAVVTALVHAPAERGGAFDELGCLDSAAWAEAHLPLGDEQIEVVPRPVDQAGAVLRGLQSLDNGYAAERITIGVCDDSLTPTLQQHLPAHRVAVRDAAGTPVTRTGPYRLLVAVADYLERRRFGDFAVLLRHPDLAHYLLEPDQASEVDNRRSLDAWLDVLDRYFNEHLQGRVTTEWLGDTKLRQQMKAVYDAVHAPSLLGGLTGEPRPLREWAEPILQLLRTVYAAAPLSRDRAGERLIIEACQHLRTTLTDLHNLPHSLEATASASEAIRTVLRELTAVAIPPEPREPAVELLGPLELHLDDAPVLLITGVNEGKLPESVNADAFLPNALRAALGLEDNDRRYARDAYALTAIVHSRPHVRLIAGRRDAAGDPLAPSRLLFAAEPAVIADRVMRFYGEAAPVPPPTPPTSLQPAARSGFIVPPPLPEPRVTFSHMAVTEFKLYLQCPYRYYLQRGLRLRAIDDDATELDALRFGGLAHDVLEQFGRSDAAHATDPLQIADTLRELLHELVRDRFGSAPLPAVRVQVKQLENRLHHFADRQAAWAGEGWRIRHVEQSVDDDAATLDLGGEGDPMPLRGRIDRIDENEETGALALLDYKTGDKPATPDATHRAGRGRNKHWIDLQLPLYRHLLPAILTPAVAAATDDRPSAAHQDAPAARLGYILLPRDTRATAFALAEWSEDELAEADETARSVVRDIRAGNFAYDPARTPPRFDPFADICDTHQLLDDDEGEEDEG